MRLTPEERAHELRLLRESQRGRLLTQREVFLLEEIARLESELSRREAEHMEAAGHVLAANERLRTELAEARAGCAALLGEIRARFSDLAVEMEKHSNNHIREDDPAERLGAAVEGVCADRINDILKKSVIPTDAAAALAKRDAALQKRLSDEGSQRDTCGHFMSNLIGDNYGHFTCDACTILAEEKRRARLEEAQYTHDRKFPMGSYRHKCDGSWPECARLAELRAEKGA